MAKKPRSDSDAKQQREQALISISEAARRGYAARPTIHRHLKAGRLSASKLPDGSKRLSVAELHRVYGDPEAKHEAPQADSTERFASNAAELTVLRERVRMLEAQVIELQADKAWLREQFEQTQRRLTDQRPGWLQRILGASS